GLCNKLRFGQTRATEQPFVARLIRQLNSLVEYVDRLRNVRSLMKCTSASQECVSINESPPGLAACRCKSFNSPEYLIALIKTTWQQPNPSQALKRTAEVVATLRHVFQSKKATGCRIFEATRVEVKIA